MEKSIVETIMEHLLSQLSTSGEAAFKRNQMALHFGCSPAQITYILDTKFRQNKHYVVEIVRGSAGYVRIRHSLSWSEPETQISPKEEIKRAYSGGLISKREALLMLAALEQSVDEKRLMDQFLTILRGNV
jgi:transcriptional regulator CtsR